MPTWQPARSPADAREDSRTGPLAQASSAVALLVVAAISIFMGLFFAIPALVLGVIAVLLQRRSNPWSARIARWGWIAYVLGGIFMLLVGVALVVVAGYAAGGNG